MPNDDQALRTRVRLDKWLWAARFYKTRSQAAEAIHAGHVKSKGSRLKTGHSVAVGERIDIHRAGLDWQIEVVELSERRGSGADAQRLYRETEEGQRKRLVQVEEQRAAREAAPYLKGRPTKRDRRAIIHFRGGADG